MSAPPGHRGGLAAALFACVALAAATAGRCAASCDATCLTGLASLYMDALTAQHWQDLPWADTVHYAENSVKMQVGEGVWATATGHSATPLIVADPVAGTVAWIGTIDEHGQPGFYALELTIKGDRIAAVQSVIRRKEGRPPFGDPVTFSPAARVTAPPAAGPAGDRDALIDLAEGFFAAQTGGAGGVPVSFAQGCRLIENGVPMTGNLPAARGGTGDCAPAFQRRLFQEYEGVRHRIVAVDPARALVVAIGYRDLPAAAITFTAADGRSYPAEAQYPRSVGFVSVMRVRQGAIAAVETVASELPYLMPFPW